MRFTPDKCPECGGNIHATVDDVPGFALLNTPENGEFGWAGETDGVLGRPADTHRSGRARASGLRAVARVSGANAPGLKGRAAGARNNARAFAGLALRPDTTPLTNRMRAIPMTHENTTHKPALPAHTLGPCRCDNCGHGCDATDLNPARDLEQRLDFPPDDPRCTLPAGECPHCGALAYAADGRASR